MRTYSLIGFLAILLAGPSLAVTAQAEGPSMQKTEQYIVENYNKYSSDQFTTITVNDCAILFTTTAQNGNMTVTVTTTVPMAKVEDAMSKLLSNYVEIDINAWDGLSLFTKNGTFSGYSTESNSAISSTWFQFQPDAIIPAERIVKAITHYAKLCGSVDPNAAAPDPSDPFSQ